MVNPSPEFSIRSSKEAAKFEERLLKYEKNKWHRTLTDLSLPSAFDKFDRGEGGNRLFAATFDLRLAFSMAHEEIYGFGPNYYEYFFPDKVDGNGVLESEEEFETKLQSYRHQTAFVLRFRAFLDKLMGFLVMLKKPDRYDEFVGSKSRRKSFAKLFNELSLDQGIFDSIVTAVDIIDTKFRTAEAHGSGVLRKLVFQVNALDSEHRDILLIQWKEITGIVNSLPALIEDWGAARSVR
jgi:hypothetical protein